jgi:hypothetical protein
MLGAVVRSGHSLSVGGCNSQLRLRSTRDTGRLSAVETGGTGGLLAGKSLKQLNISSDSPIMVEKCGILLVKLYLN